jgi:hypothetical protein
MVLRLLIKHTAECRRSAAKCTGSLEKKKAGFKADKVEKDIAKWGDTAGAEAVKNAATIGLLPVDNAENLRSQKV